MSDLADLRRAREARAELTALIKAAGGDMPEKDVLCVTVWPTHTHTHTRSFSHTYAQIPTHTRMHSGCHSPGQPIFVRICT